MTPWLTDAEIAELCEPLEQAAAQVRYLRAKNLHVDVKRNGRPLVMRSELERVLGAARLAPVGAAAQNAGQPLPAGPNVHALQEWAARRNHGAKTQGR